MKTPKDIIDAEDSCSGKVQEHKIQNYIIRRFFRERNQMTCNN